MILALDVHYEESFARTVRVLFDDYKSKTVVREIVIK